MTKPIWLDFTSQKIILGERVGWSRLSLVHQAFPKMGSAGLANGADLRGWRRSCLAVGVGAGRRVRVVGVHTLEGLSGFPGDRHLYQCWEAGVYSDWSGVNRLSRTC